jgi:hypothetical protein
MLFAPVKRMDITKLEPVEAIAVEKEKGKVVLTTDTQSVGTGTNTEKALVALKENSLGIIYLDTVRYLLVESGAEDAAKQLAPFLHRSVAVSPYNGGGIKEEVRYLDARNFAAEPWE